MNRLFPKARCARQFPEPCDKPAEVCGVVTHYAWCKACFLDVNQGQEFFSCPHMVLLGNGRGAVSCSRPKCIVLVTEPERHSLALCPACALALAAACAEIFESINAAAGKR